jgi:hypothetical protein
MGPSMHEKLIRMAEQLARNKATDSSFAFGAGIYHDA